MMDKYCIKTRAEQKSLLKAMDLEDKDRRFVEKMLKQNRCTNFEDFECILDKYIHTSKPTHKRRAQSARLKCYNTVKSLAGPIEGGKLETNASMDNESFFNGSAMSKRFGRHAKKFHKIG